MTVEQQIREDTVRALLRALPPMMVVEFGYLTNKGDATSFVREHVRDAARSIGVDVTNTDKDRAKSA